MQPDGEEGQLRQAKLIESYDKFEQAAVAPNAGSKDDISSVHSSQRIIYIEELWLLTKRAFINFCSVTPEVAIIFVWFTFDSL